MKQKNKMWYIIRKYKSIHNKHVSSEVQLSSSECMFAQKYTSYNCCHVWGDCLSEEERRILDNFGLPFHGRSNLDGYLGWWHIRALVRVLKYVTAPASKTNFTGSVIAPPFSHLVALQDKIQIIYMQGLISWICISIHVSKIVVCVICINHIVLKFAAADLTVWCTWLKKLCLW